MRLSNRGNAREWTTLAPLPAIWHPTYTLSKVESTQLLKLWLQLRDEAVRKRGHLQTAIRRFGYAGERTRTEDRFIDLMVAAEAMFLGERRKGETTGELTYKISMRFAHFAKVRGTTKRARYEHMKKAYGARSSIVHGDRPKSLKTHAELDQFTALTADHLRHALRQMIAAAQAEPDAKVLIDWDDLVLGSTAVPAPVEAEDEA
jgi:hypothetical protein